MYLVAGDVTNIALDPLFMFVFGYGVSGAAIAHVISQYVLFNCNSNTLIIPLLKVWKTLQSTFMQRYLVSCIVFSFCSF